MRDFRDAKSMAQTLRESLTAKAVTISHSESLELVSKMLGVADWNTLSALLRPKGADLNCQPRHVRQRIQDIPSFHSGTLSQSQPALSRCSLGA